MWLNRVFTVTSPACEHSLFYWWVAQVEPNNHSVVAPARNKVGTGQGEWDGLRKKTPRLEPQFADSNLSEA